MLKGTGSRSRKQEHEEKKGGVTKTKEILEEKEVRWVKWENRDDGEEVGGRRC